MDCALIAAIATDGAIGQAGGLPWGRLQRDMQWFRAVTMAADPYRMAQVYCRADPYPVLHQWLITGNLVVCGRRTYETLPKPLLHRHVVVLRQHMDDDFPTQTAPSLPVALTESQRLFSPSHCFVIGGVRPFAEALQHPACAVLYLTEVTGTYPKADTWWPATLMGNGPHPQVTMGRHRWRRTCVSPWIEEPDRPRYRFGIWERASDIG